MSIIGTKLSKRSDILNWGQIVQNWHIIVRIKYNDYIYYSLRALGKLQDIAVLAYCQLSCPHMWQIQDKARGLTTIDLGVIVENTNLLDIAVFKDQHNW